MACESVRLDLVAFLQDELEAARASQVRDHVDGCRACAAELEGFKSAQSAARRLRVAAPSHGFDEAVRQRIAAKIAELRARGSVRFRTPREQAEAAAQWPGLGEWLRRRRRLGLMFLLAALVLVPAFLAVWVFGVAPWRADLQRRKEAAVEKLRLGRELAAALGPAGRQGAQASRQDLSAAADGAVRGIKGLADGPVRLVALRLTDGGQESPCILVYTAEQWRRFQELGGRVGGTAYEALWRRVAENPIPARVEDGTLRLPEPLFKGLLESPGAVAVLALPDHFEVWDQGDLQLYLNPRAIRPPKPPAEGPRGGVDRP